MRVLAQEVGEYNITVNEVAPGWTISDITREAGETEDDTDYIAKVPMKRRGTDMDIANAVLFLASDLAGFYYRRLPAGMRGTSCREFEGAGGLPGGFQSFRKDACPGGKAKLDDQGPLQKQAFFVVTPAAKGSLK